MMLHYVYNHEWRSVTFFFLLATYSILRLVV